MKTANIRSANRLCLAVFCLVSAAAVAENGTISLEQYLGETQKSNLGYQGSAATQQGDLQAAQEATLPFATQFFGNYQHIDDNRQTVVPLFEGTRTLTDTSQIGFKKLFDFGLQSQVSYGVTANTLFGVSSQLVPQNSLFTSGLTLQLTQSLWQNGFGKADQATRQVVEAQDLANSYTNAYQTKTTLADAESRYWSLAISRELIAIQKASFDRTVAIRDINAKRARAHLIDESDLLTSQAQAKAKQFDLKTAIDNERIAARAFNSARGVDSDLVEETLALPSPEIMQSLAIPERAKMRDDVKAAEQTKVAISASSKVATQKQLPVLNIVGTASSNGLEANLGPSVNDTLTPQYPYLAIGVNFSMPLDTNTVSNLKKAYAEQIRGAELTYRRRLFDQENDWKDLVKKLQEGKERLSIAVDVEKAQKLKFQHEENRRKEGAATTYQVFQYEIDYLTSELNRVQTQAIILGLVAQMKTYRSDQ